MKFTKAFLTKLSRDPKAILDSLSQDDVVGLIQFANYNYYTVGKPVLTDDLFEVVKDHMKRLNPRHPILKHVGALIDDSDSRKEKLPYWMGSMDKIKSDSSALSGFVNRHSGDFVVSDKLDGNSALYYFDNGVAKLFTRGDGEYGQNISHLIPFINGIPNAKGLDSSKELTVRGELIMSKEAFEQVKHKGANARNMVAGLANAKVPDLDIARRVNFVAYSVYFPKMAPSEQLDYADKLGFATVFRKRIPEHELSFEVLSEILLSRRASSDFEVDGIVVTHNKYHAVVKGKNPSYAFAFKSLITQETAEVVVSNVEWNVSKDGYIKPVVQFEGVKLSGVLIKRATGFNADYIKSNTIGPGARILITRSGDVIPYILKVLMPAPSGQAQMPSSEYQYVWTDSRKDIVVVDGESSEVKFKQLESFFKKMDVKGVGPATVRAMFDAGLTDINHFIGLTEKRINEVQGLRNKAVVHKNIIDALKKVDCITLMDASNTFGRGFGERKLKSIVQAIPKIADGKYIPTMEELLKIEGVSDITASKFVQGLKQYRMFMSTANMSCEDKITGKKRQSPEAKAVPTSRKGTKLNGQFVVFTGFRNREWEGLIEENGGKVTSTVSSKTTMLVVASKDGATSKVKAAMEKGIAVITKDEFQNMYT